ncbi:MAG: hypothetical protein EOO27_06345 [Comamonadaceae bacterium]|nr:MAG: hypothetical protein EOO27_06345 [Comamonadaceae bacterium]
MSDFIPPGVDVEVAREGLQRALLFGTPQDVALAERKVTVALEWQAAADRVTHQAYIADLLAELPTPGGAR